MIVASFKGSNLFKIFICLITVCILFISVPISGPTDKHEFQAETRKLLDIVAKSLYSEKEVSNTSI